MTFSTSHTSRISLQSVYKPQESSKITYNQLQSLKHIATHQSLVNYLKYFQKVYALSVWTKRLHKTFSTPHSSGKFLQLVYKPQESYKVTYNKLQSFKSIATHPSLINYMKYFQQVYELSVWTKMLHMTFSTFHSSGKFVQLVYKLQESYKVTYNQLQSFKHIAIHQSLINYMKYFQQVYELSVWTKRLHKTFSTSHSSGIFVQLVYKRHESYKVTYNQLQSFKHIATHQSLNNYLQNFQQVYELSVQTKMIHYTFSTSQNSRNSVQPVYKPQQSYKLTYN